MGSSQSASHWKPDKASNYCECCYSKFTLSRRRHHCRSCGGLFCAGCTSNRKPVPDRGYTNPVRVCLQCMRTPYAASPRSEPNRRLSLPVQHVAATSPSVARGGGGESPRQPMRNDSFTRSPSNRSLSSAPTTTWAPRGTRLSLVSQSPRGASEPRWNKNTMPLTLMAYIAARKACLKVPLSEAILEMIATYAARVYRFNRADCAREVNVSEDGSKATFPAGGIALLRPVVDRGVARIFLRLTTKGNTTRGIKTRGTQVGIMCDALAKSWKVAGVGVHSVEDIKVDGVAAPCGVCAQGATFGLASNGGRRQQLPKNFFGEVPCEVRIALHAESGGGKKEVRMYNTATRQAVTLPLPESTNGAWAVAFSANISDQLTIEVLE
eukprot:PhM_4_TR4900/c0_g1_i1/m.32698